MNFTPSKMIEADVEKLREAGLDDRGIVEVVSVVCLYNFMNRMADALGAEIETGLLKKRERSNKRLKNSSPMN